MLILARKVNESIIIGDEVTISVVDIKGDQVKLGITAPERVKVYRREVYDAIQAENLAAAHAGTNLPILDTLVDRKKKERASLSSPPSESTAGDAKKQQKPTG